MEAQASFRHHKPVVLDSDYRITRFIDRGSEANAADLSAACEFVAGRFDLDLGVWDLARDPLLRRTLLKPEEIKGPESGPIAIPADLAATIADSVWAWRGEVWGPAENAERAEFHDTVWPILETASWQVGEEGTSYFLPLAPTIKMSDFMAAQPLLSYAIHVHKDASVLRLIHSLGWLFEGEVEPYLQENASALVRATAMEPDGDIVVRLRGHGLESRAQDWAAADGLIRRAMAALEPSMGGLLEKASQRFESRPAALRQREEDRRMMLHGKLWPILEAASWQVGKEGYRYLFPLGPRIRRASYVGHPVLWYSLDINKKRAQLRIISPFMECESYLQENASVLMDAINSQPKGNFVLRLPGHGWDDDVYDWGASVGLIRRAMAALEPSMSRLRDSAIVESAEASEHLP